MPAADLGSPTPQSLAHLSEHGYVVVQDALDPAAIDSVKAPLASLVVDAHGSNEARAQQAFWGDPGRGAAQTLRMTGLEALVREHGGGAILGDCPRCGEVILDAPSQIRSVHAFFKRSAIGRPTPLHQDPAYAPERSYNNVTFWMPLADSSPRSSGLSVIPGSHRSRSLIPHRRVGGPDSALEALLAADTLRNEVQLTVPKGAVVLHRSYLVHGSSANRSDSDRIALVVVVGSS